MTIGASLLEGLEAERREVVARGDEGARVHDAATLIIVDERADLPRFLMGMRGARHVFMANRFVFPGGRVDACDRDLAAGTPLSRPVLERLTGCVSADFTAVHAGALAFAAIRETYEETGLLIAGDGPPAGPMPPAFAIFAERGVTPAAEALVPVARAITPDGAPRRFDTRFFVIGASSIAGIGESFDPPTDELERVGWISADALDDHSIAPITRAVLGDVMARIADGSWQDATVKMPFYRVVDGRFQRDLV
ncbi:NUDIX hydrolase [Jiella avicenniae]|uniref:NUDIX hydrolase n=1 Tax=Jiella avicenniae TaxID=2907202 RepID=A0A9X1TBP6_9HYPH|nr:NUDIX hydrolase [Jiella avicenniae]MCE7028228.1 NUDIX hydrolase [Jiella avicenniae]